MVQAAPGRPSVWRVPLVSVVAAATWLVSVPVAIWLGVERNGVDPDRLGGAGPDVYDVASKDIRLMLLLSTAAIWSVATVTILTTASRNRPVRPASTFQLVGTTVLWIATGLMCLVTAPFFLTYVLAPSLGA